MNNINSLPLIFRYILLMIASVCIILYSYLFVYLSVYLSKYLCSNHSRSAKTDVSSYHRNMSREDPLFLAFLKGNLLLLILVRRLFSSPVLVATRLRRNPRNLVIIHEICKLNKLLVLPWSA